GSMADLDAAKVPDVQAFFDTYYAPNNATLVVVGDFTPGELRHLVNQYFAGVPSHAAPEAPRCESTVAAAKGGAPVRREVHDAQANLDLVMRLYRIPEHRHADTQALEILNIILGQGESSRLNVSVVRHDKAALGTGTIMNPYGSRNGPGVFAVYGIVNQGVSAERLDSLLSAQLDTIRTNGISAAELEKAKNAVRAGVLSNRGTTLGKAEEPHPSQP